jgi:hypothetical protein
VYTPTPFVWMVRETFVSLLMIVTVAPGTAAPEGSVTVPVMLPVADV